MQLKQCRYQFCKHNGQIDIDTEPFIRKSNTYLHEDCYKAKCDLELIRNLWKLRINQTTSKQELSKVLNKHIENGYSEEYLLFMIQFIINHKLSLKYPGGIKYYIDDTRIKEAYRKSRIPKVKPEDFKIEKDSDDSPTFTVQQKKTGFGSILHK